MSVHINAKAGEIAKTVLIPGDPLRAKFAAENLLDHVIRYNDVRGMYGYTGYYQGKRVSIQGTGMGMPSTAIYINELVKEYDVENLIRVGTCGSLQKEIGIGEVILAMAASTESSMNKIYFQGMDYAPSADFHLLQEAYNQAQSISLNCHVGGIFSSDSFYDEVENRWDKWIKHGILGVEMETSILYTLAARLHVKGLSILTVSDNVITGEISSSKEREQSYLDMIRLGFSVAPA